MKHLSSMLAATLFVSMLAGCPARKPAASPAAGAPAATSTDAAKPTFPATPAPVAVTQGDELWAVYLATSPGNDDAFRRAAAAWNTTGLPVSSGEIGCDDGAKQAGITGAYAVTVYFKTQADAAAFAAGTKPAPVGVAKVSVHCAD